MKRDQWIGLGVSVGSIILAIIINWVSHRQEVGLRLEFYILPALGFIFGLLMVFTDFESVIDLQDTIDELPEAVSDDLEALKSGKITFPIIACIVSIASLIGESWLIFHFRKWNAEWFGVSVLLISTIVVIATAVLCFRSEWFQDRWDRLHWKIFVIPLVGFIICGALGAYYAEPRNYRQMSLMERDQLARSDQYSASTRGGDIIYIFGRSSGAASDVDIDCDGDECMAILLIVVVIVCIAGSAIIPHFWVLATMLLLTIMIMVALRELLYYERKRSRMY